MCSSDLFLVRHTLYSAPDGDKVIFCLIVIKMDYLCGSPHICYLKRLSGGTSTNNSDGDNEDDDDGAVGSAHCAKGR